MTIVRPTYLLWQSVFSKRFVSIPTHPQFFIHLSEDDLLNEFWKWKFELRSGANIIHGIQSENMFSHIHPSVCTLHQQMHSLPYIIKSVTQKKCGGGNWKSGIIINNNRETWMTWISDEILLFVNNFPYWIQTNRCLRIKFEAGVCPTVAKSRHVHLILGQIVRNSRSWRVHKIE